MISGSAPRAPRHLAVVFRAFTSRNYRLYFSGLFVSMTGSWMQSIAMSWLIYRLTHKPFLLGLVAFLAQAPALFLNPLAGVLADRFSKRRIIALTQSLAALQALALAVLTFTDLIRPSHIVALSLFLGLVMPFDVTARQSFVLDVVGRKEYLGNAIALNSVMFNLARFLGPALAGILTAWAGEELCFLANALSYGAALAALWALRIHPQPPSLTRLHFLHDLRQGLCYAWTYQPVRILVLLTAFISIVALPYHTLLPIFAHKILGGGARTLGFLNSGVGLGALAGALYLASRTSSATLAPLVTAATALLGSGLVAFSFSRSLPLSLAVMPLVGLGILLQLAATNTLLQTFTDDHHRGRVVSLYTTAMMGLVPYGCLIHGGMAHLLGAPITLAISGFVCLCVALACTACTPTLRSAVQSSVSAPSPLTTLPNHHRN